MADPATSPAPLLVVDLDGTVLKTDALHETFWAAFSRDWKSPFAAMAALLGGRAALKRRMAGLGGLNVAAWPYNAEALSYIARWRHGGGRVALVTAADQEVAEAVAAHLNVFDAVHGSDGRTNLKGAAKAAFIEQTFGANVAYMGDAPSDLAVWNRVAGAVTVNAPAGLRARVDGLGTGAEHLGVPTVPPTLWLRAIRPHQWLKNTLLFLPMLAAHDLSEATLGVSLLAFVAFCMVASGVYVLNDLLDLAADRAHPRKRLRPFASGDLPIRWGVFMTAGLLGAGALVGLALGWAFLGVLAVYLVATTAYSLHFKRRTMIDICTLAGLYALRIVAGGQATGIPLSVWLLAFALFFFFALAAIKRQAELVDAAKRGALSPSGRGYHVEDLPVVTMIAIAAGYLSVLVLALYVDSPAVTALYSLPSALWGICLVLLYWISRMALLTSRGRMHDDPLLFALTDGNSLVCAGVIAALALGGAVL